MNLISFELLRNLPLVPSKLFDFQSPNLSMYKNQPKPQLDATIQNKLFSKFPEEVIEALQIIIAVFYSSNIENNPYRSLQKAMKLLYFPKSSVCFLMKTSKSNVSVNISSSNSAKLLKTKVL